MNNCLCKHVQFYRPYTLLCPTNYILDYPTHYPKVATTTLLSFDLDSLDHDHKEVSNTGTLCSPDKELSQDNRPSPRSCINLVTAKESTRISLYTMLCLTESQSLLWDPMLSVTERSHRGSPHTYTQSTLTTNRPLDGV